MLSCKFKLFIIIILHPLISVFYASHLNDSQTFEESRKKVQNVRILSIDSGGVRGVMPITALNLLEKRTAQPISKLFSMVGGTSVGSLITALLTTPSDTDSSKQKWSAKKTGKILAILAEDVLQLGHSWKSLYDANTLELYAKTLFGDSKFSDSIIPSVSVTFDCLKLQPKIICSWDKDEIFRTSDVVLASTALPIALEPRYISPVNSESAHKKYFVADGFFGGAGNPTKILLEKAKEYYPNAKTFEVVSLGSGTMKFSTYSEALNPYNVFLKIADIGINLANAEPRDIQDAFNGHYTRINPTVTKNGWAFDGSAQNINHLIQDTKDYLQEDIKTEFDELIDRLKSNIY